MRTLTQRRLSILVLILVLMSFYRCSCGGSGTTQVGNSGPDATSTVTVGKMSEGGNAMVYVSLGIIGEDENDLVDTTIDVAVNGETESEGLEALGYYDSDEAQVAIPVKDVSEGDIITITIHKSDDTYEVYKSTVSSIGDSTSILESAGVDIGDEGTSGTDPDPEPDNAVTDIKEALCDEVTACISYVSDSLCLAGLNLLTNLTDEFGVTGSGTALTLEELELAVEAGTYTSDDTALAQCLTDIEDLSCSEIQSAYSIYNPTNFDDLEDLIPSGTDTCGGVF
ncbi:hypothetical protein KJ708_05690 [bacterium]|nr:hypothetical protein [bacterium]